MTKCRLALWIHGISGCARKLLRCAVLKHSPISMICLVFSAPCALPFTSIVHLFRVSICISLFSLIPYAYADEGLGSDWLPDSIKVNTFGTLSASYHTQKGLAYRPSLEPKNTVESNQLDFATGSILGGQISYLLNDQLSGTVQMVSRNNAWGNYQPEVAAAYVKYAPSEAWNFRLGRLSAGSVLLGGDSRFAGYSYTSVRPSPEVFGIMASYDRFDGMDVFYRQPFANGIAGLRMNYGDTVGYRNVSGVSEQLKDARFLAFLTNWQTDTLDLKAFWAHWDFDNYRRFNPLADTLSSLVFSPTAQLRAQQIYAANDYKIDGFGLGMDYEVNQWKLQMIAYEIHASAYPGYHGENGSALLSYRTGAWTHYVGLAYSRLIPSSKPLSLPALPALQAVEAAYDSASTVYETRQSTLSLGVRYDLSEHYALKMQLDKINSDKSPFIASSSSTSQGANLTDKDLTLLTFTLDFFY